MDDIYEFSFSIYIGLDRHFEIKTKISVRDENKESEGVRKLEKILFSPIFYMKDTV